MTGGTAQQCSFQNLCCLVGLLQLLWRCLAPREVVVLGVGGPREQEEGGDGERAGRWHIQQGHNSPIAAVGKLISDGPIKAALLNAQGVKL